MKCAEVENYITDYIDGNLDKDTRNDIEKHLTTCSNCREVEKQYREMLQVISDTPEEEPAPSLRSDFYKMLQRETGKMNDTEKRIVPKKYLFLFGRIAAGLALLIAGTFIGMLIQKGFQKDKNAGQIADLQSEVKSMKEMMMHTMLKEESPSQRIKAVNIADQIPGDDPGVIKALIHTMNTDKNMNVRLAAVYSLEKFADNPVVKDSLLTSLRKQTDPVVQVVLMNILVKNKDSRAVGPMRAIISNSNTLPEVKNIAEKSIEVLL